MLRQNQQDRNEEPPDQADAALDASVRRKTGARRTAWIIAAIAVAFFIASLVQGHFVRIPH